jgi:hypothetical protein
MLAAGGRLPAEADDFAEYPKTIPGHYYVKIWSGQGKWELSSTNKRCLHVVPEDIMMCLKIGIARGVVAICLASTAISGVALALDRDLDRPPPAGAIAAADATDASGIAITPSQNAPGVPPAPPSTAAVPATANSSPGSSVTLAPNMAPLPPRRVNC